MSFFCLKVNLCHSVVCHRNLERSKQPTAEKGSPHNSPASPRLSVFLMQHNDFPVREMAAGMSHHGSDSFYLPLVLNGITTVSLTPPCPTSGMKDRQDHDPLQNLSVFKGCSPPVKEADSICLHPGSNQVLLSLSTGLSNWL